MELSVIAYDLAGEAGTDTDRAVEDVLSAARVPDGVLATAAFTQDRLAIRVVCTGGPAPEVVESLSRQDAERLGLHLAGGPAPMLCVQSRFIEERPAGLAALRYRVRPGYEQQIREVFAQVQAEARPTLRNDSGQAAGVIVGVGLFVRDDSMIRVVLFDGELDDVARYMSKRGGRPDMERKLAPYMAEERHVETPAQFLEQFRRNAMRRLDRRLTP